jgi:hypothetical protein
VAPQPKNDVVARLQRVKQASPRDPQWIGAEMISFFKNSVQKRHTKLGKIAECWSRLVPELLSEHCALESFSRGTLAVIVDSSPHLYELKQLLLAGLERQLCVACASTGLRKVTLRTGRWYESNETGDRRVAFRGK